MENDSEARLPLFSRIRLLRLNVWEPFIKESFASFFVVRLAGTVSVGGISEFVDLRTRRAWPRNGWLSLMNHPTQYWETWKMRSEKWIMTFILDQPRSIYSDQSVDHVSGMVASMVRLVYFCGETRVRILLGTRILFRFRDVCRMLPLSYVHLSLPVSNSSLSQRVFILLVDKHVHIRLLLHSCMTSLRLAPNIPSCQDPGKCDWKTTHSNFSKWDRNTFFLSCVSKISFETGLPQAEVRKTRLAKRVFRRRHLYFSSCSIYTG